MIKQFDSIEDLHQAHTSGEGKAAKVALPSGHVAFVPEREMGQLNGINIVPERAYLIDEQALWELNIRMEAAKC